MHLIKRLLRGACSLAAPRLCAGCRAWLPPVGGDGWRAHLCGGCSAALHTLTEACRGCGHGLGPFAAEAARCDACRVQPRGCVRSTTALLRYHRSGRALLARLKYHGLTAIGQPLGRDLGRRFCEREPLIAGAADLVVVAVPLHPWRRWRRGFNQAHEIARGVAAELDRPLVRALRRRRATRALFGVPRESRAEVVAGAFRAIGVASVASRRVALVDDIRTSGATLREAGRVLRAAGAKSVDALVVGR